MPKTKLEAFLIIIMVLFAIGAVLMGFKTLNTTNQLEKAIVTLSKDVCGEKEAQINWVTWELYCIKDNKIVEIVELLAD